MWIILKHFADNRIFFLFNASRNKSATMTTTIAEAKKQQRLRSPHSIDSGTYKVNRSKPRKSQQQLLIETPAPAVMVEVREEEKEDEAPEEEKKEEITPPSVDESKLLMPPPQLPEIPSDQTKKVAEIVEKVKKSSSFRRNHQQQSTTNGDAAAVGDALQQQPPLTPPPSDKKPLCEAGERLLRKMSLKRDAPTVRRSRDAADQQSSRFVFSSFVCSLSGVF